MNEGKDDIETRDTLKMKQVQASAPANSNKGLVFENSEGVNKVNKPKVSFRDKVVGINEAKSLKLPEELKGDRLATITDREKEDLPPKVCFSVEARTTLTEPYNNMVVIKVLGKHFSYAAIVHKLRSVWRLKGGYEVLDVGFDYFLIKFDLLEDRDLVLLGGPWMIAGNYLAVKPWDFSFKPCKKSFGSAMVWIRISGMNIWYYQEQAMLRIVEAIGKPVKVDLTTKSAERGKFARACIQIDLGKPVKRKICIDDYDFDIEYESLHLVCGKCNCYGHVTGDCQKSQEINAMTNQTSPMVHQANLEGAPLSSTNQPKLDVAGNSFEFGKVPFSGGVSQENDVLVKDVVGSLREEDCIFNKEEPWIDVKRKCRSKAGISFSTGTKELATGKKNGYRPN